MKKKTPAKPFWELSDAEKDRVAREFDKPMSAARAKPLNRQERARFERAVRAGLRHIHAFNLDEALISEAEAYARRKKLTLVQLIERGLRRELAVKD